MNMLFEWGCWGFGQIVIVIMWQPGLGQEHLVEWEKQPLHTLIPLQHVNDADDAKERTKDKTHEVRRQHLTI